MAATNGIPTYSAPLHPELEAEFKKGYRPFLYTPEMDMVDVREKLLAGKTAYIESIGQTAIPEDLTREDIEIPARDGYMIPCRKYAPKTAEAKECPLVIDFHGGGFCVGGLDYDELQCRRVSQRCNAVVLNVDYRLAPEHVFPTGPDDAWDVVKWAAANHEKLGCNPRAGFILSGISAGANFACVTAHRAGDAKLSPPLTGLVLSVPVLMAEHNVPEKYRDIYISRRENEVSPGLDATAIDKFYVAYEPDEFSEFTYPVMWPTGHSKIPPTYFQICELDPLMCDSIVFERILREENGIPTRVNTYKGLPHAFYQTMPQLKISQQANEDAIQGFQWLLSSPKK